ncbi:MAG: hypothetical protein IKW20_08520 [Bacteroidales bacterium]|nr:hypothetical protein [Bacteroidales bacterium]
MKRLIYIILTALSFCVAASAQHNFRTGYFLDGYTYNHKLNPALASDRGYFAIPVLGYTTLGVETNMSLAKFLYPDGKGNLDLFLSPNVSANDFLKGIQTNNPINANLDLSVFSLGFHAGKSFNTLDLSFKADARSNLPGSLFSWAKQAGNVLDMSDFGVNADARVEFSYGYSRKIGEKLRIGAKLKFVAALAKASYAADHLILTMNEDKWRLTSQGSGYFYAPGVSIQTDDLRHINGIDILSDNEKIIEAALNVRNFGAALDLGFTYDIFNWLTVSASVTDLGGVRWSGLSKLGSDAYSVEYSGFDNIGNEDQDVEATLSDLGDELIEMIQPKVMSTDNTLIEMLSMTAHAGLELRLPFYKRLSAGLLGTYRYDGPYSWWEARASLNWALFRWLSFSGSYAQSTYGESYGGAINFHPNVLNIFVGIDSFKPALNVTDQYIPIDSFNTNLAIGVNIAFGKYHGRFPRKAKKSK